MSTWQRFMQAPTPGAAFQVLQQGARSAPVRRQANSLNLGPFSSGARPAPARPEFQGPAFGNVAPNPRVGGGNAGRSTAGQWEPQRRRPPVEPLRTAPIVPTVTAVPRNSGASQAAVAAQNAAQGVKAQPSWSWDANPAMRDAAMAAGTAAAAARGDIVGDNGMISKIGGGYLSAGGGIAPAPAFNPNAAPGVELGQVAPQSFSLSPAQLQEQQAFDASLPMAAMAKDATGAAFSPAAGGGLPDTSNPASDAYWQRADIQEWANSNQGLANSLRRRHGLSELGKPGSVLAVAPAGFDPSQTAFSEPAAPIATDPVQRMAPGQMAPGAETGADLAQEVNREHLERLKLEVLRGDENLASPSYFQPGSYEQPAWPQGWFQ
jgi:hypothetical protein